MGDGGRVVVGIFVKGVGVFPYASLFGCNNDTDPCMCCGVARKGTKALFCFRVPFTIAILPHQILELVISVANWAVALKGH